jgi:Outer membrane protein beta-barrel domain
MASTIGSVLTVVVLAVSASAQVPKGNVFIGYSYLSADTGLGRQSVNGWNASLEGKVLPFIGLVGDFSGHYGGSQCTASIPPVCGKIPGTLNTFLFGLRISASAAGVRPFAHAMFGASHERTRGSVVASDTAFATAIGGGLDFRLAPVLGWRVQGDYLQTRFFNSTQNNVRLSTGLVLRF